MNDAYSDYQEQEFEYHFSGARRDSTSKDDKSSRSRRMQYSRSNRPTVSHNGIHRRRNKRFAW
jgi:hypothetical protein